MRARRARSGPEGPARGPEGPARASVARPLYLKLLTRHALKPDTRQAKIPHITTADDDYKDKHPTTRQTKIDT